MTPPSTPEAASDQSKWPAWIRTLLQWLAIAAAFVGALTVLLAAVGKLRESCEAIGYCKNNLKPAASTAAPVANGGSSNAAAVAVAPGPKSEPLLTPAATPAPIPNIAPADSGWVDGGSSPDIFCRPQLEALRAQYTDLNIDVHTSESSRRDMLGHVTYRYHCFFSASRR